MDKDHRFAERPPSARAKPIKVELVAAKAIAKAHPDSFAVPVDSHLRKVKPGDLVKVARNGERFWVLVTGFEKRRIHGQVANMLEDNDELPFGQAIFLQKKNIYSWVPKNEVAF